MAKRHAVEKHREWTERDMALYRKHWWPLKPLPHHHPSTAPTRAELRESQAPQEKYAMYWRSLPKFNSSKLLEEVQQAPYFKLRTWRTAASLPPLPTAPTKLPQLLFVCHHKTGENLQTNIQEILPHNRFSITKACEGFSHIAAWRTLHFVRDPIDMILSGYRYHQFKFGSEVWSWGHGKVTQDPQCFDCDDDDHKTIFDSCRFNCTYFELLNRLPEIPGVITEAVSARQSVTSMAALVSHWANTSDVLHLSFNLFKASLAKTCACIVKFLGLDAEPRVLERLFTAVGYVADPQHVTEGKYANDALKAYLRDHFVWGREFLAVKKMMKKVFRNQARRWGCPGGEAVR